MTAAANEFFSNVQLARKRIFKRQLIWGLSFLASGGVVASLVQSFPKYMLILVGVWGLGFMVFVSPLIRRLQKMPCPYCHYAARVSILPFRHFRCMHCHRSIGESAEANRNEDRQ
jgi:uncharacterized membrane protein